MVNPTNEFAIAALLVCAVTLACAITLLVLEHRPERVHVVAATIDWPPTWAEILAEREQPIHAPTARVTLLADWREREAVELAKPHRHNVHCAKCGRFARAAVGWPGVADCAQHGLTTKVVYLTERLAAAA